MGDDGVGGGVVHSMVDYGGYALGKGHLMIWYIAAYIIVRFLWGDTVVGKKALKVIVVLGTLNLVAHIVMAILLSVGQ